MSPRSLTPRWIANRLIFPFWMSGSTIINLSLLLPFEGLTGNTWDLVAVACGIQIGAVIFSLLAPVPINNRIEVWTPSSVPGDWKLQERRWGAYHWFRTCGLIVAFALLCLSLAAR
jgi:uncharacterized membrane protein